MKNRKSRLAIGDRVRVKDTRAMRAWAVAGLCGAITGLDPRGDNPDVFSFRADDGRQIFPGKGIHADHLEVLS